VSSVGALTSDIPLLRVNFPFAPSKKGVWSEQSRSGKIYFFIVYFFILSEFENEKKTNHLYIYIII